MPFQLMFRSVSQIEVELGVMKMLPMFPKVDLSFVPRILQVADFQAKKMRGSKDGITIGNGRICKLGELSRRDL